MKYKFTKEELKKIKEFEKNFKGYQAVMSIKSEYKAPEVSHLKMKYNGGSYEKNNKKSIV